MAITRNHTFPNAPDRSKEISQILADLFYGNGRMYKIKRPPVGRNKYIVMNIDNEERIEEVKELVVHTFSMGDVEDPDLYAAEPLIEWERSEFGRWVFENALEAPSWHRMADPAMYGYKYQIRAKFAGPALTELLLKYGGR